MWTSSFRGEKVINQKRTFVLFVFFKILLDEICTIISWWKSKLSVFLSPPSVCTILYFPEMRDSYFHEILKTAATITRITSFIIKNWLFFAGGDCCYTTALAQLCYIFDFSLIFLKRRKWIIFDMMFWRDATVYLTLLNWKRIYNQTKSAHILNLGLVQHGGFRG